MVTDAELISSLDAMADRVDGVREDMAEEGRKRDLRIRTNRRALIAAIAAALIGIGVGAWGVKTARDANAERDAARIGSCQQYNKQQTLQSAAEVAQSHDLVGQIAKAIPDPLERKRAVDAYNGSHDALIASEHTARDCSAAGIRRYLSQSTTTVRAQRATTTTGVRP